MEGNLRPVFATLLLLCSKGRDVFLICFVHFSRCAVVGRRDRETNEKLAVFGECATIKHSCSPAAETVCVSVCACMGAWISVAAV